jgi:predicted P-loop ATPase
MLTLKGGASKPAPYSIANFKYLLSVVLKRNYYINSFSGKIHTEKKEGVELDDIHLNNIFAHVAEKGLGRNKDLIQNAINEVAVPYHPIRDQIESIAWDGRDRISELFDTITLHATVTPAAKIFYRDILFRKWLLGTVNRAYNPGEENGVLIFKGKQGGGKSRWFKALAQGFWPNGYSDGPINPDNKDHQAILVDYFIHHTGELDYVTSNKHVGALKDYFNKAKVTFRRPYDKLATNKLTVCNFCASVNEGKFLQDLSGNRRYFIIPVDRVKPDHGVDMQQVAAQAKAALDKGAVWWLNEDEIGQLNGLNQQFLFKEEFIEIIEERVSPGTISMSKGELLRALGVDVTKLNKTQKEQVNVILEKMGLVAVNHSGVTKYKVKIKPTQSSSLPSTGDQRSILDKVRGGTGDQLDA